MRCDIILAGVGGQGVLSLSAIIASGALREGLHVRQSEVHGMAQRGGAVIAHLRMADAPIHSNLIRHGTADLILGMEPVESLRYLDYLSAAGSVVTSTEPVINVPDYPDIDGILGGIRRHPRSRLVDAPRLAREAGSAMATNMVMVGSAADLLPVATDTLEALIREMFARKGERVVETNLRAFRLGREASRCVAS